MTRRYDDCTKDDGECRECSLSSYGRDCHNNPISNLVYLRSAAGLTQEELAKKAGMHKNQVYKIEAGKIDIDNITAKNALGLAKALGITVEELLS